MASSDVIEVFIETLHGTAFELLVSPADTVVSIKSRISRLEGAYVATIRCFFLHLASELRRIQGASMRRRSGTCLGSMRLRRELRPIV